MNKGVIENAKAALEKQALVTRESCEGNNGRLWACGECLTRPECPAKKEYDELMKAADDLGAYLATGGEAAPADKPAMWRREWEGDDSDLGQWIYADTAEERDEPLDRWQPLYEAPQPAPPPMTKEEWEVSIKRMHDAIRGAAGDSYVHSDSKEKA